MKAKSRQQYKHKGSSREYLIALLYSHNYCEFLNIKGKAYEKLVRWIIDSAKELSDSDNALPDLKTISKLTQIPYSHIAKYLRLIYQQIHDLNDSTPSYFKEPDQKLYELSFNYLGSYGYFNLGLDETPRTGEQFVFSFIKPQVGSDRFWVKGVNHEIYNGKQTIVIRLTHEQPNQYLKLLQEKAYLTGEIDWHEYYGFLSYDTERRLVDLYRNL